MSPEEQRQDEIDRRDHEAMLAKIDAIIQRLDNRRVFKVEFDCEILVKAMEAYRHKRVRMREFLTAKSSDPDYSEKRSAATRACQSDMVWQEGLGHQVLRDLFGRWEDLT